MADYQPKTPRLWQRFVAFLLDILLAAVLIVFVNVKFLLPQRFPDEVRVLSHYFYEVQAASAEGKQNPPPPEITAGIQGMLVYSINMTILLLWFYFAINGFFFRGSSLGKRVFRIAVVDGLTYMPVGFLQNISRSGLKAATLFYFFPVPFFITYFLIFFNKNRLTGYDYISRTLVVEDSFALLKHQQKALKQEQPEEEETDDEA